MKKQFLLRPSKEALDPLSSRRRLIQFRILCVPRGLLSVDGRWKSKESGSPALPPPYYTCTRTSSTMRPRAIGQVKDVGASLAR
jgi:hypothetical protein